MTPIDSAEIAEFIAETIGELEASIQCRAKAKADHEKSEFGSGFTIHVIAVEVTEVPDAS